MLDRLLTRILPRSADGTRAMSFRLTYATMFNPPGDDARALRGGAGRVESAARRAPRAVHQRRGPRAAQLSAQRHSPIDSELVLGEFALADAADVDAAMEAAHAAFPAWRALPVAERARCCAGSAT